jgi:hypothetical protein
MTHFGSIRERVISSRTSSRSSFSKFRCFEAVLVRGGGSGFWQFGAPQGSASGPFLHLAPEPFTSEK